ncbi:hypothetical protein ABT124_40105 [Streptomyces sp. NPDC001982]|uniref:hypothetical protein n=1 Tax=Streptomyces sp. NPDC001982 TaxID=3154405 RepID=UPI00332523E7
MALAVVRDLRELRDPVSAEELEQFETDVLAGFVLARASAGLADGTIRGDVGHLDQVRAWFGRPLWEMEPADTDVYFGKVLRGSPSGTRLARAQALTTYFLFLELRHKVEIHRMTSRVVECPIDEMNRPRGSKDAALRIPLTEPEVKTLFTGWGGELATCRKFAPTARNYTATKLMSQVGRRVSEACKLDLADIDEAIATACTPDVRLIIALAAVHAARPKMIRTMQLDDVDLGNRRITVGGHVRPLDDLTRRAVLDWLDYRRSRWPNTANPHLLITQKTAVELGPAGKLWTTRATRNLTATLERLRVDRQLEEALTHGADPLHLALVFGIDEKSAIRYADSARALLGETPEQAAQ